MKKFLRRVFIFFLFLTGSLVINIYIQFNYLYDENYFKLPLNVTTLILGHSHAANAYNTKFITNSVNLSNPGESYFYTYIKARTILKFNPQIKTIYLEFTNNQIERGMDNWVWDDTHLIKVKDYGVIMNFEEYKLLYQNNTSGLFNVISKGLVENFIPLIKNNSILDDRKFGGYLINNSSLLDSLKRDSNTSKNRTNLVSQTNLNYLTKIVDLCDENNVEIIFVRSPMNKRYDINFNETVFRQLLKSDFSEVKWLDFKDYPLPDEAFGDSEHLNSKGAILFSTYFNQVINATSINQN